MPLVNLLILNKKSANHYGWRILVVRPTGFEPATFRVGVGVWLFCLVLYNFSKACKI